MPSDANKNDKAMPDQNQAHPPGWPGIPGRSKGHEPDLETGTPREQQAHVTDAQRRLEEPSKD